MRAKPKKRLGQNFLFDANIQRKIIEACELNQKDIVLEIGSGRGELTRLIAPRVEKTYALEIDPDLYKDLKENLKACPNVCLINQDILRLDLDKYFTALGRKIKVIGNIPYYISSPIIAHLVKFKSRIESIFITVQKEFARRMCASCGSKTFGAFSCFVQYFFKPKIIFDIKKTCFYPLPKVSSCLLRLDALDGLKTKPRDEKLLFKIIRAGFGKRRKTLRNSLKGIIPKKKLKLFFNKYRIDVNTRPESLSLEDFTNLSNL